MKCVRRIHCAATDYCEFLVSGLRTGFTAARGTDGDGDDHVDDHIDGNRCAGA